jgi:hypothetical protein
MKYSIVYAIKQIETKYPGKQLRYIEYEDGSGATFVFGFVGERDVRFIRFT